MPINDKQKDFINEYLINGHNGSKAYKKAYPDCIMACRQNAQRLLTNAYIRTEIAKRMAESEQRADRTVKSLDAMYQKAYDLALTTRIPAAMNQSVTGIARLYSMDQPGTGGKDTPKPISNEDLATLRAIAKAVTDAELAKPKLAKDIA